jgi:hypothetical protein
MLFLSVGFNIISLFKVRLTDTIALGNGVCLIWELPTIPKGDDKGVNCLA